MFRQNKFDAVIHFAGLKAVDESVTNPRLYHDNNVGGSKVLLECMREAGVKTIVFSSSATVYGEPGAVQFREDFPLAPVNPYGRTKLMIEELVRDAARADESVRAALLRYFNPVGAHASGLIGEDPTGVPNNLMPYIAQVATGKRAELPVYGNDYPTPDGTCLRDYVHVADVADALPEWRVIAQTEGRGTAATIRTDPDGTLTAAAYAIVETITDLGRPRLSFADAQKVAGRVSELFDKGEFDVSTVIFNRFKSAMTQVVTVQQLIPPPAPEVGSTDAKPAGGAVYEFEPDEGEILADLLPRNLTVQIFRALLENAASFYGSQMTAMDNASRNAGEVIKKLTLQMNRSRQASITKELIEIISGAEAV